MASFRQFPTQPLTLRVHSMGTFLDLISSLLLKQIRLSVSYHLHKYPK